MNAAAPAMHDENALLLGQMHILEMVATAAPLAEVLTELTRLIESQEEGLRCGVLIVDADGKHFCSGYGPNLPELYHQTVDGARITPPYLGPCAQAAHQNIAVTMVDAASEQRWAGIWHELTQRCGLAACRSTPIQAPDGSALGSFAMYYGHPRDPHPAQPKLIEIATHLASLAIERTRTDMALREGARVNALLMALPVATYTTDAQGRITFYNQAAAKLWGRHPQLDMDTWCGSWRLYGQDGRLMPHEECPMAIALKEDRAVQGEAWAERPDGSRVPFLAYPSPLHDASGSLTGAVNMLVDITERKHAEEQRALLINELYHRVKNTLITVQSIAAQTMRGEDPSQALGAFEARLLALSKTHDVLTRNSWQNASLRQLLEQELIPYCGDQLQRCRIEGSDLHLPPKIALALGMALHELATNAAKYGALSRTDGQIRVAWDVHDAVVPSRLRLRWSETGGPPVQPPRRRGFGSRLIEHGLAHELDGEVAMTFDPAGLVCTIGIPLPEKRMASA
jgi:PAS domain S-box-containing protein